MENESTKQVTKDFGVAISDLAKAFQSLQTLTIQLTRAGPNAVLSIPSDSGSVQFGKKELRQATSSFIQNLKDLKQHVRAARRKPRKPVEPSSFSGVYTPVYVGDALRTFFNEANFGPVDPATGSRTLLVDNLPLAKTGYLLRNTITMLFFIHAYSEGLQNQANAQLTRSSPVMLKAFGGKIPAEFYTKKEMDEKGNVVKTTKIRMSDAVKQGVPQMNTYDTIRAYKTFDPAEFKTYFFQNIASANYYSIADLRQDPELSQVAGYLEQQDIQAHMLSEHQLVKTVSAAWRGLHEAERARKKGTA